MTRFRLLLGALLALAVVTGCAATVDQRPAHRVGASIGTTTTFIPSTTISGTTAIKSQWATVGSGAVSLQLVTTGTVSGSWKIELSNQPGVENNGDSYPSDVTSGFQTPAGSAIAAAAGSPTSQFVQATLIKAGAIRVTFTPSSGAGTALANASLP
jgi:hypothetical protein